jgi:hypothetical protein
VQSPGPLKTSGPLKHSNLSTSYERASSLISVGSSTRNGVPN